MTALVVAPLGDVELLADLARDAERDGHRMVSHLIADWRKGINRFDVPGEALYASTEDDVVNGVCGLNVDPFLADPSVGRVRRLYVLVADRRRGIGSVLVDQIVHDARSTFERLRLRTYNPVAAAFYESRGFSAVAGDETCTHQLVL